MTDCARTREHLPELVRGDAPDDVRAHVAGCDACRPLALGAGALAADLGAWTVPAAPDDLVARTLAGLALVSMREGAREAAPAGIVTTAASLGRVLPMPLPLPESARPRRRSSVEILTSAPLGEVIPLVPPTRRQLALRVLVQAAAALLLFGVSTTFVAVFYPAMIHAVEQKRLGDCQERLRVVAAAMKRYRQERPDAPELRGSALRAALVQGGYVDAAALVCPGPRGHDLGENSFMAELPPADPARPDVLPAGRPVCWDRFGNHAEGFNVVYGDGRVEVVPVDGLARWMQRGAPGE